MESVLAESTSWFRRHPVKLIKILIRRSEDGYVWFGPRSSRRRVSAGKLDAWKSALAELGRHRRDMILCGSVAVACLVIVNLPWFPSYQRGLLTGVILTGTCWLGAWLMWVTSGHSLRLNGVWAEQEITKVLAASEKVYAVIPSFKFHGIDIDTIAITRVSVLAVETKWHLNEVDERYLDQVAYQAARACRTLRHQLAVEGLPTQLIQPLVVLCGRKAAQTQHRSHPVQVGSVTSVDIVGASLLERWLDERAAGHITPDFADRIRAELGPIARQRDEALKSSWLLRRLARISG